MELSKILAITGRPGLYKMLAQTKNGLVVESLLDGKRLTAFSHERISSLEEISIFTTDEDLPLKDVLKKIFDKQNGEKAISHKSDAKELKAFFKEAVPNYDEENVYVSDIKKVIQWYNLLQEHNLLEFDEEEEKKEDDEVKTENQEQAEDKGQEKEPEESENK
jgi:hypothetical protein